MGEKIVIGPLNKGLRTDVTPFNVDNTSFPTLINAYQWRGRVKRKRGTSLLGRLSRFFNSSLTSYSPFSTFNLVAGAGNLLTGFNLQATGNIVPGSVMIVDSSNGQTYTDPSKDGTLVGSGGGSGTINYATGDITISGATTDTISAVFTYYPVLPVMGIEDLVLIPTQFPGTLAFDTVYSYNVLTAFPYPIYDVSFYKNPPSSGTYVQKTNATPVTWNGKDYQQFWTTNYEGALWATNGIPIPFISTNIGMQFAGASTSPALTASVRLSATTMSFTVVGNPLVVGDFVFVNEFTASGGGDASTLNFQTGYVTTAGNTFIVTFPNANITAGTYAPGIVQYLTNRSDVTKDCLRWYDGDPTNGNFTNPSLVPGHGWVNFCPPLSQDNFSIAGLPPDKYYLVNARMIVPYKDRLLFLGPVVQSSGGRIAYLQDVVIYSQNGTPYYTASFQGNIFNPTTPPGIQSLLVPDNQTAFPNSYWEDQTGFGGFVQIGISQPITTVSSNEDVLILGLSTYKIRLVYSGNDLVPFVFYIINAELGDASTFSSINMDKGVISRGTRGYIISSQVEAQRIDLEIPDQVFEIDLTDNGNERFCAARDFINEWIYFTYNSNSNTATFPNQTLLYNYRDNSWAIFNESYTTYGAFRRQTGFIWSTVGLVYPTWGQWNEPWNAGESTLLQQEVLAGNQQGFLIVKDEGTGEATTLEIKSFSGSSNVITSPNHNLSNGNYIIITGCKGTVGNFVNNSIFSVFNVTQNTFQLDPDPMIGSATYFGGGLITIMYVPQIQSRQFPSAWSMGRKTRLGVQQYLLSTTQDSQITLQIFLSQNASSPYNLPPIVPSPNSMNNSLIYSQILYTCPESTNLGLIPISSNMANPANTNLQMPTAVQQAQIWHRINTSLIGDTVQFGFTLSDEQMRDLEVFGSSFVITGASKATSCVLTCGGQFPTGTLIEISGVVGMVQLNGNIYHVITSDSTTVTINVNSTSFDTYISGGTATAMAGINGFAEIEFHGCILDVTPSQMLS